jgi:CMP-N-acetylneuraminic acid synthetase
MADHRECLAIILARGGSKGLPGKNIKPVAGKPLLAYSIEAAQKSGLCTDVLVSTDDEEIAAVAREYGAWVPFLRPDHLATDEARNEHGLVHVLEDLEKDHGITYDIVVYLQPTDLFRSAGWIRQAVQTLKDRPEIESAFSAHLTPKNFWTKDPESGDWVRVLPEMRDYMTRQNPKRRLVYREDTGVACATRAHIVREGRRIGDKVELIVNEDFRTGIDIHDEFDHWLAEQVMIRWGLPLGDGE